MRLPSRAWAVPTRARSEYAFSVAAGRLAAILLCVCTLGTTETGAQTQRAQQRQAATQQQALQTRLNEQTLLVVAGHPAHSYVGMTYDMAAMLRKDDAIRLVPIMGSGGLDNLRDLLFLRGVDLALVPANVLAQATEGGELVGGSLQQRLVYVASLYAEELHLLAGRGVASLEELRGRKVAVPVGDGNAAFTAADILRRMGVAAEIVHVDPINAIDQIRAGELSAALLVGGKPLSIVAGLPKDGSLRLLGLRFTQALEEAYVPGVFRASDYPALIPPGATVETVSIGAVLMASSAKLSDSQRRIAKFVPSFFEGLTGQATLQRHPKWTEVNLGAELPGWSRLPAAQEWLDSAKLKQAEWLQKRFEEFLRARAGPSSASLSEANRRKLFDDFITWTRKSVATPGPPQ